MVRCLTPGRSPCSLLLANAPRSTIQRKERLAREFSNPCEPTEPRLGALHTVVDNWRHLLFPERRWRFLHTTLGNKIKSFHEPISHDIQTHGLAFATTAEKSKRSISANSPCKVEPQHRSCDMEHMMARSKLEPSNCQLQGHGCGGPTVSKGSMEN